MSFEHHYTPDVDANAVRLDPEPPGDASTRLQDLAVSADSVVVTVVMTPTRDQRAADVSWGDESSDFVDFDLPQAVVGGDVAAGSFLLQHVYRRNPLTGIYPNYAFIVIAIHHRDGRRTFDSRWITLVPRFRFVFYPVVVRAGHHDGIFETHSEFDIRIGYSLGNELLKERSWRWEPRTFDPGFPSTTLIPAEARLEDSHLKTEITYQDDPLHVATSYVDDDGQWGRFIRWVAFPPGAPLDLIPWEELPDVPSDFDGSQVLPLHPRWMGEGAFSFVREMQSGPGTMSFHFSGDFFVLTPGVKRQVFTPI